MLSHALTAILMMQPSPAAPDMLHSVIEGDHLPDSDEFRVLIGAGCSLRCAIDWVVAASRSCLPGQATPIWL
jgi:hypothetical protein